MCIRDRYKVEEVDGPGDFCLRAVLEPQRREGDAAALEPPVEGADERREALDEAEEAVGVQEEATVGEAVRFAVARRAQEEVGLGALVDEAQGGQDIRHGTHYDHLDAAECLGQAEKDLQQDRLRRMAMWKSARHPLLPQDGRNCRLIGHEGTHHELGEGAGGEEVEDGLAQVVEAEPPALDAGDNGREVVEEDQVRGCTETRRVSRRLLQGR